MDPITHKELIEEVKSLQERGLSFDGAVNRVTKAYSARVIIMEDGEEVAMGDVDLAPSETEPKAETPAEEVDEVDEDEDVKSAKIDAMVQKAVDAAVKANAPKPQPLKAPKAEDLGGDIKSVKVPARVKSTRVRNIKGVKDGMSAEQRAYLAGCWYLTGIAKSLPKFGGSFPQAEKALANYGIKVHVENNNSLGGYSVPEQFGTDIIDLREEYGVARQLFKTRSMTSDTRTDPRRTGGLTAYFVGEGAAITESNKSWDQVRLTAKKLAALTRYTSELNEDSVLSIGDDLTSEIAYAFTLKEDQCAFNGDGTSTYGGITGVRAALQASAGSPTTTSAGGVIVGTGNAYSELNLADFEAVIGALPEYAANGAKWVVSRSFYWNVMKRLELASGGVTAAEASSGNISGQFLGSPVVVSQVMPTTAANSQLCALYGNFDLGASFGDRRGVAVEFSDSATVGGENVFERDEIAVRGLERFDINVHDTGSTTEAGPIVGLQTLNA